MSETKRKYATDIIVDLFKEYNIEYVSANIGSSFRALWESLVNYGNGNPELISAPHEEIAVGIAHGYAKVTNKPMIVLLHDTVGLLHATMAIYNAWCDRVPLILIDANGPLDVKRRRPWIDWVHTTLLPNSVIRDYVKWDDYAISLESFIRSFIRAYNITTETPSAPVFIGVDVNVLEQEENKEVKIPKISYNSTKFYPDVSIIKKVANEIAMAENPLIIAGRAGIIHENVNRLVNFAELTGSKVIDTLEYFNFPNTHPLDATFTNVIQDADVILAIDSLVLDYYLYKTDKLSREYKPLFRSDAKIFVIGNPIMKSWASDYEDLIPAQLIRSDSDTALDTLISITSNLKLDKEIINERIHKATETHNELRRAWLNEAKNSTGKPVSLSRLNLELWNAIRESEVDWVLTSVSHGEAVKWSRKIWDWTKPGCYIGWSRGAGLGYGLPIAIGASFALKEKGKLVIDLQPDGDLLYTSSALWVASHNNLPLLIVMYNNRAYFNDADHNALIAKMRNRDSERAFKVGGEIKDPPIDFATLAKSFGLVGIGPIDSGENLSEVFKEAINTIREKKVPVLVDIVTST
ncbi:thiamine pyrophosphate-dependent enzyme [Sulfolobus tengchongensis]|uniref:2-oxoacid oxidoreductase (ferredoxin) n=1 Tax=Sulfolobus tengchongensis TaxID=207809 RepID=A0AAX4L4Q2_9CREN